MGGEDSRIVLREQLLQLVPWLDELDAARWHLVGYDTYAGDYYPLYESHVTEAAAQVAALRRLVVLEVQQPTETSGGQADGGIQDRVFILGPGGIFYRAVIMEE